MPPDAVTILLDQQRQTIERLDKLSADVSAIKITLAEQRGARRVGMYLITTLGGIIGAIVTSAIRYVGMHR